jgi:hypothetical protein
MSDAADTKGPPDVSSFYCISATCFGNATVHVHPIFGSCRNPPVPGLARPAASWFRTSRWCSSTRCRMRSGGRLLGGVRCRIAPKWTKTSRDAAPSSSAYARTERSLGLLAWLRYYEEICDDRLKALGELPEHVDADVHRAALNLGNIGRSAIWRLIRTTASLPRDQRRSVSARPL